jgi:hypothetical protein
MRTVHDLTGINDVVCSECKNPCVHLAQFVASGITCYWAFICMVCLEKSLRALDHAAKQIEKQTNDELTIIKNFRLGM